MPVEIKELVIKAEFGGAEREAIASPSAESSDSEQEDLIQECVRQVLEVLDRQRDR